MNTNNNSNNFDFLRLTFASLVIVSHSFPLTGKPEWFAVHTNEQLSLGSLSVDCFFIMSGYLIFISLKNSKSVISYLWKRVLRLFPALFGLVLTTGIILTLVSKNPLFILGEPFRTYSINIISLYKVGYYIGDIFASNPYPKAINGSLWSLSYEFTMYLVIVLLFPFRRKKLALGILAIFFAAAVVLFLSESNLLKGTFGKLYLDITQLYKLATYFFAGSLLSFYNLKSINSYKLRWILFSILILSLLFNVYKIASVFILPLFILLVANTSTPHINSVAKKTGDLSYGIYIYGFLIQQTLMYYFSLKTWELTISSLIISSILAYLSWNFIESKMIRFKNLL